MPESSLLLRVSISLSLIPTHCLRSYGFSYFSLPLLFHIFTGFCALPSVFVFAWCTNIVQSIFRNGVKQEIIVNMLLIQIDSDSSDKCLYSVPVCHRVYREFIFIFILSVRKTFPNNKIHQEIHQERERIEMKPCLGKTTFNLNGVAKTFSDFFLFSVERVRVTKFTIGSLSRCAHIYKSEI